MKPLLLRRPRSTIAATSLAVVAIAAALTSGTAQARSEATPPANTSPPTISGVAELGQTLSAGSGSWTGDPAPTFSYQWQRCNTSGASCSDIAGATGQTRTLVSGDVGRTLRVEVTGSSSAGTAVALSAATAVVTGASAPTNTGEPTISGTPVQGQTLSATSGSWTGTAPISYAYQWVRCGTDGGAADGSNCPSIQGATGTTYVAQSGDVGSRLRVRVTATNSAGSRTVASNPTATVAAPTSPPKNAGEPAISGTPTQGQTLTATSGSWTGTAPISFAYQWVRCGADGGAPDGSNCAFVQGATRSTYRVKSADVGRRLRVRVTASNSVGSQTVASNPTETVISPPPSSPQNTGEPTTSGTTREGHRLRATVGSWTGTRPMTFTFQWVRCGADGGAPDGSNCLFVAGATRSSYVLRAGDIGRRMRVRVTARNSAGSSTVASNATETIQSGGTGAIVLPNGKVSIPVARVSLPVRLIIDRVVFRPNPVRTRRFPFELRVHVIDTRGYWVRDALVFARSIPVRTLRVAEQRTGLDGWATLRIQPKASFPLRRGRHVQFFVRARKDGDSMLGGVSTRRLVQVRTARP